MRCYTCGDETVGDECRTCETELDDRDSPSVVTAVPVPVPAGSSAIVSAVNWGAAIGLGLIFVLMAAFLAAAYYAG